MRLVVTAADYDEAVRFYRDVLGLPERESYASPDGRVMILEAGRATLEIADPAQAEFIDRVEVGRRVAGHIRVAFEVADSRATTRAPGGGRATVIAEPTLTPWQTRQRPPRGPAGLQLTLFSDAPADAADVTDDAARTRRRRPGRAAESRRAPTRSRRSRTRR